MSDLDIELLRTFSMLAETGNFTQAGDRLGATQSAISLRLKKLEERLGRSLFARTPRNVDLTPFGALFLKDARRILATHDAVLQRALSADVPARLTLGVSEHAGGPLLNRALRALRQLMPRLEVSVMLAYSSEIMEDFARGSIDCALVRGRGDGAHREDVLFSDRVVFMASPECDWRPGEPLPFIAIAPPCTVRASAITALKREGIDYREVFSSRGMAAVLGAVAGGLGIGCAGLRHLPAGAEVWGAERGLPEVPDYQISLLDGTSEPMARQAVGLLREALISSAAM